MIKLISATFLALVTAVPCLAQSSSQDTDNRQRWESRDLSIAFVGSGVRRDVRGIYNKGETIYSTQKDLPGNVSFICLRKTFMANVALEPADFRVIVDNWQTSSRARVRQPTLLINGESAKPAAWTYSPTLQFLYPRKTVTVKKLYNAAIRGDTVQIKLDGSDPITLVLPKPNAAFADFGADCGLGRNAKKD